jgi:hypothetical protein
MRIKALSLNLMTLPAHCIAWFLTLSGFTYGWHVVLASACVLDNYIPLVQVFQPKPARKHNIDPTTIKVTLRLKLPFKYKTPLTPP